MSQESSLPSKSRILIKQVQLWNYSLKMSFLLALCLFVKQFEMQKCFPKNNQKASVQPDSLLHKATIVHPTDNSYRQRSGFCFSLGSVRSKMYSQMII